MTIIFMSPCYFDRPVNIASYAEMWCNVVEHMRNNSAHICCACPMMMSQVTSDVCYKVTTVFPHTILEFHIIPKAHNLHLQTRLVIKEE